jgi:hypothetical protein
MQMIPRISCIQRVELELSRLEATSVIVTSLSGLELPLGALRLS